MGGEEKYVFPSKYDSLLLWDVCKSIVKHEILLLLLFQNKFKWLSSKASIIFEQKVHAHVQDIFGLGRKILR